MTSKILPVFISFYGCRQRCVYCNQNSITGKTPTDVVVSASAQIRQYLDISDNWDEIAFYGGSFTCLSESTRKSLYALADEAGISRRRFSTSPDCIDDSLMIEAAEQGVETVEIGVQSLCDEVLKANNRPCGAEETIKAVVTAKKHIKNVACQIMTGMYMENFRSFADTVDKIIELTPEYVRIYPCVVLKDTELNNLCQSGEYVPLPAEESLARSAYGLILLESAGINVIRIGLQDAEDMRSSITAGAYHPAMGDMAKTVAMAIYFAQGHRIRLDKKYLSAAYGYAGYNRQYVEQIDITDGERLFIKDICRKITESANEDHKRYVQRETARHAERLISKADHR